MSNQVPTVSGAALATIKEGSGTSYLKTGTLSFLDADLADRLSVAVTGQSVAYRSSAGVDLSSVLSSVQVSQLSSAFSFTTETLASNSGSRAWTYALPDTAIDFLAAGEQLTVTSTIAVSDSNGGMSTKDVVITLTGTNDAPAIVASGSSTVFASVDEAVGKFSDATISSRQGSIAFSDLDISDTHTVSVAAKVKGYAGTLTASVAADTTGGAPGAVVWNYSVADRALDFLAAGQQVSQVYTLTVADGKGGTAQQDVTILLTGTNDVPTLSGTSTYSYAEGSAASYARTGTLTFADADLTDRLTTSIASQTLVWKSVTGVDNSAKLTPDQVSALLGSLSIPVGDVNSNQGSSAWSFNLADKSLDFLARLDTLTMTTVIQVDDHNGGVTTKSLVISLNGANDAPVIETLSAADPKVTGQITEALGTGSAALQTAKGAFAFSDLDLTDVHTLAVKALGTGYLGTFSPVMTDAVFGSAGTVAWNFSVAAKAMDYLAAGQTLTQTYALTIGDGKGGTVVQNVSVNLVGTNDAPVLTGAETATTVYEPLSSSVGTTIIRGGTILVSDVDANDHLAITKSDYVIHYVDASGTDLSTLPASQLTSAQSAALLQVQGLAPYLTINSTTSGNSGQITWSYSVDPSKLSFLAAGEKVTISSTVSVQDLDSAGHATGAAVIQPISVTLVGASESTSVKDYAAAVIDKTFLAAIPTQFSIGNQTAVSDLKSYNVLSAADGIILKPPIVVDVVKDGATFDGVDFRGKQIVVEANNVTFVNCLFDSSGSLGQATIVAVAGYSNLTVDHSTFDGLKVNSTYPNFITSKADGTLISNNIFKNAPADGIQINSGTVTGNYFVGSGYYATAHADAIWVDKTTGPVVIENNVIDWRTPADALTGTNNAIRISGEGGNVNDVTIKDNILLGGNYTITVTKGATWTHTADQVGTITNVKIIDNIIDLGRTGAVDFADRPTDLLISGNALIAGAGSHFGAASVADLPDLSALQVISAGNTAAIIGAAASSAYILGGVGSDQLSAGTGAVNVIQGGLGRDFITGGAGTNIFLYKATGGVDWIFRFNDATDKFDIASLAELQGTGIKASDWLWLGTGNFTGSAMQIRYAYNSSVDRTIVSIDTNGDLVADLQIQVSGNHSFTPDQFILERAHPTTSILGTLWSGAGLDTVADTLTIPFTFANAPLVVRDGVVALQDSDGTLLPISGIGTYKFLDGTIIAKDGNALVDDLFYNAKYHAVLAGPVDAESDYAATGWAAGRDPNALFSTKGYLAAHSDVAAANMNPLEHWLTLGWTLGYDTSATFDVKTYLLHYKDVMAAGIDPLTDYLTVGKAAGRVAYGAIGDAVSATGFDSQYYLLAHPEVATSGLNAYEHYQSIGWQQGFNPNAFFDVAFYLAQNPSVAASGVDPLQDFMNGGWLQGRNPSAAFDVAHYLAANPDVAASGVNPLLEFLQYGANEGRLAFAVGVTGAVDAAPMVVGETIVVSSTIAVNAQHGVLANDRDADGDALVVKAVAHDGFLVGSVVHGSFGDLTLNADGSYSYTVTNSVGAIGAPLLDQFNYVVSDGKGGNSSANLVVHVDRMSTVQDDTISAAINAGTTYAVTASAGVLANDSDPDGALHVVSINGTLAGSSVAGMFGTLIVAADGSYSYTRTADSLPANATESFAYTVSDEFGATSKAAFLTIKVSDAPLNQVPTISGDVVVSTVENAVSPVSGVLIFADADVGDKLVVTSAPGAVVYLDSSGVDQTALLDAGTMTALKAGFALSNGDLGSNAGSVGWSYSTASTAFDFLGRGETAAITTVVKVDDGHGGTALQNVVVTVVGTNDAPVFSAVAPKVSVVEPAGHTGSATTVTQQGTLGFADLDLTDTHVVSVSMASSGYVGSFSAAIASDTTGGGNGVINWTFTATDKALDFLGAGQTVDQIFRVALSDGKGGLVRQDVVVTLVGSDDLPVITGSTGATWYEGSATNHLKTGVLTFVDPDLTDHVTTSIGQQSVSLVSAAGVDMTSSLSDPQLAALKAAFSMPVGDLGSNKGSAAWSYAVADTALDFLGQNDVLKVVSQVQANDGHGGVTTQDVTMTLKGINDAPVITGTSGVTGGVVETAGVSGSAALLATTGAFQFADADLSDAHSVRVTAKGAGYLGTFTPVVSQDTTGGGTGTVNWTFQVADKALDGLAAGQIVTQTYSVAVSDGKSGVTTQDVTVTLTGTSDQFNFTTPTAKALPSFAAGDTLGISASGFGGGLKAGALDASFFSDTASATVSGHGQFYQDAAHKTLYWDVDGTGSKAPVTIASFASAQILHHSDIMVL